MTEPCAALRRRSHQLIRHHYELWLNEQIRQVSFKLTAEGAEPRRHESELNAYRAAMAHVLVALLNAADVAADDGIEIIAVDRNARGQLVLVREHSVRNTMNRVLSARQGGGLQAMMNAARGPAHGSKKA